MFYCKKISVNKGTKIMNTMLGIKIGTNKQNIYIQVREFDCGNISHLLYYKMQEIINKKR